MCLLLPLTSYTHVSAELTENLVSVRMDIQGTGRQLGIWFPCALPELRNGLSSVFWFSMSNFFSFLCRGKLVEGFGSWLKNSG